jgi:hypothetical protein
MLIFGCLQGDAVNRTGRSAEIARHTPLTTVRVAGEDNAPPPPWRQIRFDFGIEDRLPAAEHMQENLPYGAKRAQHVLSL